MCLILLINDYLLTVCGPSDDTLHATEVPAGSPLPAHRAYMARAHLYSHTDLMYDWNVGV